MARIQITARISLDESELEESFIQSSGPGGQNVNKVASAVQLRFDTARLPPDVRDRLARLAGSRLTKDGVLVLTARQFRDQSRNRAEARARLFDLIRAASVVPKKRRPTKPSRAAKERRLQTKKLRARLKKGRGTPFGDS
jgi:ribosome-associated protein